MELMVMVAQPTGTSETFWMLLSLLALPIDEQISAIGGLPDEGESLATDYGKNPASHLLSALFIYASGWLDEFYPKCPNAEAIYAAVNGGVNFKLSRQDFINSDEWKELRKLAKLSLKESGLDPFPVPEKIDFNQYIEIVDEE